MTRETYNFCKLNAERYGNEVAFWIRNGNAKEAGRKAKYAIRWALWALEVVDHISQAK